MTKKTTESTEKVLFLPMDFPPSFGGIQTYLYEIAKRYDSQALVLVNDHENAKSFDQQQNFVIQRVKLGSEKFIARTWRFVRAGLRIIKGQHVRITHVGHIQYAGIAYFLKLITGTPYSIFGHGSELLSQRRGIKAYINRFFLRKADILFANSGYTKQLFIDLGGAENKITVVPLGVDVGFFRANLDVTELKSRLNLEGKKIILTVSRLVERKGHDQVIRALPEVLKEVPDACYLIAGEGPYQSYLEKLAQELQVNHAIQFMGSINYDDLPLVYNLADVFILVSRILEKENDVEGFGIVFLEAGACAKPVIGGDCGGMPDAVHPDAGILVDSLNVKQISADIISILQDPERAERMGQAGLERVQKTMNWDNAFLVVESVDLGITKK